jgi:hypothetical protein
LYEFFIILLDDIFWPSVHPLWPSGMFAISVLK